MTQPANHSTLTLVDQGRINELFVTAMVELEDDRVRLRRGRPAVFARNEIGGGDFHIAAQLNIIDRTRAYEAKSARRRYWPHPAFLFSGGDSWRSGEVDLRTSAYIPAPVRQYNSFEFSTQGFFRFKGPIIDNFQKDIIRKQHPLEDGDYFRFDVIRRGDALSFLVNDDEIYTVPYTEETFGKFGFSGQGNHEINIRLLTAAGTFRRWTPPPELSPYAAGYSVPVIDLARDLERRTVVAAGEEVLAYTKGDARFDASEGFQHPTTVLLEDGRTMFCVFNVGHGGRCGPMRVSRDAGLTWEWAETPEQWHTVHNCPCIHSLTDATGVTRLFVFASTYDHVMVQAMSLDQGARWSEFRENGLRVIGPPITIQPISGNRHLALYDTAGHEILQTISADGGLTWGPAKRIATAPTVIGEPCVIRSPDGRQLLAIIRENSFWYNAQATVSDDEGETWSELFELPGSVTGHRHLARYDDDGRIVMVFRDMARATITPADFVGWVGTYDDLINCREGQYRLRLIDNSTHAPGEPGFTGYPGLERLPDGTFVATTYAVISPGNMASIVATRFTLAEIDDLYRTGRNRM